LRKGPEKQIKEDGKGIRQEEGRRNRVQPCYFIALHGLMYKTQGRNIL
jgi:hypothetical protein